jgi:hypothetical protein
MVAERFLKWVRHGIEDVLTLGKSSELREFADRLHRELSRKKLEFSFEESCVALQIPPDDQPDVAAIVFQRCIDRAWEDGDLTAKERRSLDWLQTSLKIPAEVYAEELLTRFRSRFVNRFRELAKTGAVTRETIAELQPWAAECQRSASELVQMYCRDTALRVVAGNSSQLFARQLITTADWHEFQQFARELGFTAPDVLPICRPHLRQHLNQRLLMRTENQRFDEDEIRYLRWLCDLLDDRAIADSVERAMGEVNFFDDIERGRLPSLPVPKGHHLRSGELVHFRGTVRFLNARDLIAEKFLREVTGNVLITDDRLIFSSSTVTFELPHRRVLQAEEWRHGIEVRCSGRGAGFYRFVSCDDWDLDADRVGRLMWQIAIAKVNQTIVEKGRDRDRFIPRDVRQRVFQRDGGQCVECSATDYLEFDHIIPVAKGGSNSEQNVQLLCRKCNLKKSDYI